MSGDAPGVLLVEDGQTAQLGTFVLPKGKFTLPDDDNADVGLKVGRVEGLDYEKWAVALVDTADERIRPERVADARERVKRKGYQKLGGNPRVGGYRSVEVWVLPRHLYEQRRNKTVEKIEQAVDDGRMTDSALPSNHPASKKSRKGRG